MRSNCSPNHLRSPLLHSYVTGSFPVIILNANTTRHL